jgi:glyoxalase family protein
MQLIGIHHLTAVSTRIGDNHRFYTRTLGMRLVKRSVNQDDVRMHHLFYADAVGTPGTGLTFFGGRHPPEQRGTHCLTRTHLRVAGLDTLQWWSAHLREQGVEAGEPSERDGRLALDLTDPEGTRLSLIDDGGSGEAHPWEKSTIPAEHQVRGLGPVVMSVPNLAPTDVVLRHVLNFRPVRTYPYSGNRGQTVHVYEMGSGGPAAELHVAVQPDLPVVRSGAGGVHHVAFRAPDSDYEVWAERLNSLRIRNSGPVDRFWFRSLYFREPNGILFEIATDGPGFGVDEPIDRLGEMLALPPFLEPRRQPILAALEPIE